MAAGRSIESSASETAHESSAESRALIAPAAADKSRSKVFPEVVDQNVSDVAAVVGGRPLVPRDG